MFRIETHARQLRTMTLSRNLQLRQVEDAEIRIILSGQEFNTKTMAAEKYRVKQEDMKVLHMKKNFFYYQMADFLF
jgi:hypothetical protein